VEARFEGGQGPEGAVAPYMEWNGMYFTYVLSYRIMREVTFY